MDDMQKELDKWIDGDVVSDLMDEHGTRLVICKSGESYSAFRAFPIGPRFAVSADKQDVTADEMIGYLAGYRLP